MMEKISNKNQMWLVCSSTLAFYCVQCNICLPPLIESYIQFNFVLKMYQTKLSFKETTASFLHSCKFIPVVWLWAPDRTNDNVWRVGWRWILALFSFWKKIWLKLGWFVRNQDGSKSKIGTHCYITKNRLGSPDCCQSIRHNPKPFVRLHFRPFRNFANMTWDWLKLRGPPQK